MDVIRIGNNTKQKIKGFLVFFCTISIIAGCSNSEKSIAPIVVYENNKAVGVSFKGEGDHQEYSVYILDKKNSPILGSFSTKGGYIRFTPVIPFSTTHEFGIAHKGKQIGNFKVNTEQVKKVPEVLVIHPRQDTVPVNILKMYLEFSEPMQYVGNPLDFITVFDKTDRTEVEPFLDLEAELWDKNHTRLTLWFDPGRIKTNLIPNKERGLPLTQNHSYSITIDKNWRSADGIPLAQSYSKTIHVVGKDIKRPNPNNWVITPPKKNTKSLLKINFNELLDPILALESIKLLQGDIPLSGNLELTNTGNTLLFAPSDYWKVGQYSVHIDPILEDLAGNNLNTLFDTDLRNTNTGNEIITSLEFRIQ
ncbi:MAG: Ig-like domain-containing protein [Bacteroidota bacterium]